MEIDVRQFKKQKGVYSVKGIMGVSLATENRLPGFSVYGERLIDFKGKEYREFSHKRSKIASSILMGLNIDALKPDSKVLYLGASTGTTVSHVSDIVHLGLIYAVEFAPRPMRDLLELASLRTNIVPIHADARHPELYSDVVDGVDFVYADVAQPNQSEIFMENVKAFLRPNGGAMISIKARSISQAKAPEQVFKEEEKYLEQKGLKDLKKVNISKYHKDHMSIYGTWFG